MAQDPIRRVSPVLKLPRRADFIRSLWIGGAVALVFAVVFAGTDYITGLHSFRVHIHLVFEPRIPFVPALASLYLSMGVMFALALSSSWSDNGCTWQRTRARNERVAARTTRTRAGRPIPLVPCPEKLDCSLAGAPP